MPIIRTYLPEVLWTFDPGITWPADRLPGAWPRLLRRRAGQCRTIHRPIPDFASFDDFVNYIYANNNITWRNFNVVPLAHVHPNGLSENTFLCRSSITGAWDKPRPSCPEKTKPISGRKPHGVAGSQWLGRGLKPGPTEFEEIEERNTDPREGQRLRLSLHPQRTHHLGEIELPAQTAEAAICS